MAKSIRSKWRRKMRAEKRVKNNVRDVERLNRLAKKGLENLAKQGGPSSVSNLTTSVTLPSLVLDHGNNDVQEVVMEPAENTNTTERVTRNKKTHQDANGQYPVWFGRRQIAKIKKNTKRDKKAKKAKAIKKKSKF